MPCHPLYHLGDLLEISWALKISANQDLTFFSQLPRLKVVICFNILNLPRQKVVFVEVFTGGSSFRRRTIRIISATTHVIGFDSCNNYIWTHNTDGFYKTIPYPFTLASGCALGGRLSPSWFLVHQWNDNFIHVSSWATAHLLIDVADSLVHHQSNSLNRLNKSPPCGPSIHRHWIAFCKSSLPSIRHRRTISFHHLGHHGIEFHWLPSAMIYHSKRFLRLWLIHQLLAVIVLPY